MQWFGFTTYTLSYVKRKKYMTSNENNAAYPYTASNITLFNILVYRRCHQLPVILLLCPWTSVARISLDAYIYSWFRLFCPGICPCYWLKYAEINKKKNKRRKRRKKKLALNRSSVTNLHQEDFEPFYVISLILDGSLMQGAQPPYLDYSGS